MLFLAAEADRGAGAPSPKVGEADGSLTARCHGALLCGSSGDARVAGLVGGDGCIVQLVGAARMGRPTVLGSARCTDRVAHFIRPQCLIVRHPLHMVPL